MKRVVLLLVLFSVPIIVRGQFKITEIFYDSVGSDIGREWIEVQNVSGADLDLSNFKLFESGTNHGLSPFGNATTTAGSFAVIVTNVPMFKQDNPDFAGQIFDSTFSLSNTGEILAIKNSKGEIVDSVSYKAEGESGQSLQFVGGIWTASKSTLGSLNKIDVTDIKVQPKDVSPQKSTKSQAKQLKSGTTQITNSSGESTVLEDNRPSKMTSSVIELPSNEKTGLWVYILGLIVVVFGGLFGVYLIENKVGSKGVSKGEPNAEDFEIIEEKED